MHGNEILHELNERLEVALPSIKDGWPVLVRLNEQALEWIENNSDHLYLVVEMNELTCAIIDYNANVQFTICVIE